MGSQSATIHTKAALESRGIPADRLKANGLGTKFPITDGVSPENQRIELIIQWL